MSIQSVPQRSPHPRRFTARTAITSESLARLAAHLTARDRWLARMLFEHKVFTTHQITALAWPSVRAASLRLLQLYKWRVLDRFQPLITLGAAPMHYVLDTAGAHVLAREDGLDPAALGYRHDRAIGIAHSLQLAHTIGTNAFFTALSARSRQVATAGELTAWWSETRCHRHFGDIVRPDGYGRWREHPDELEWFLEYDCGTEPLNKVAAKIARYAKLAGATGITTPVLFWLPTTRRETTVRRALVAAQEALDDASLVPVATTSADLCTGDAQADPALARWLPLDARLARRRLRLAELASAWPYLAPLATTPGTVRASGGLQPPSPVAPGPATTPGAW